MPAYIPPHRRPGSSSNAPPDTYLQGPSAKTGEASPRGQGERPSSSSQQDVPPCSVLLQAHGDSFVGPLTQLPSKLVDVRKYSGATAKGLGNEHSSQQVGQRLIAYLDKTRPDKVLLQFGNVDINISSVYRLETHGEADWDEKQFVADVWNSYQAFLECHILKRLAVGPSSSSSSFSSDSPGYIRDLYLCTVTLPVVGDEALPESHAKYQYPKGKDKATKLSPEEINELELQGMRRRQRVKPLIQSCGMDARRRMTADFNARLEAFVLAHRDSAPYDDGHARLHIVDLNQYIRKEPGSDEVASQCVTDDPTNVHIAWEKTLPFWISELASAGLHTSHMPTERERDELWAKYAARKGEQMRQKRRSLEGS